MPVKKMSKKNIILFVGKIYGHLVDAVRLYEKQKKKKIRIAFIYDPKKKPHYQTNKILDSLDISIPCNTSSPIAIQKCLAPYSAEILAATCRGEDQIPLFAKIVPHLPYTKTPTSESLNWATDKILMRKRLYTYNKKITPAFTVATDTKNKTLKKIEEKVGFPLLVKPAGLAASRLVSICFHKEELQKTLTKTFRKINKTYKDTGGTWEPKILVEQFMEGEMYSVDGYVTSKGTVYFCPMVYIKTGRTIGFDDFFGYQQITPTLLKKASIEQAQNVATQAIHALALRSTTVHIEMMKMEDGWKIIELAARIGGFRQTMYELSYGINHTMNDILIRIPEKPNIPKKIKGYTVAMKFFAKKEGRLTKLTGIKKAQELQSFKKIYINKKIGDTCTFAKHGGSSVFNIIMFNQDRSKLLADIRRLEQMTIIKTK